MGERYSRRELEDIQAEINTLPIGYISRKIISGKEYYYRQWAENGKTKSQYIKKKDLETVRSQIARRKELQAILKNILPDKGKPSIPEQKMPEFKTNVLSGRLLEQLAEEAAEHMRRGAARELAAYLEDSSEDRVCLLLGLRRTGKTTMMYQAICDRKPADRARTAYIRMTLADGRKELFGDVKKLAEIGIRYLFVDEVPMWDDFAVTLEELSDIFGGMGMKIVVSAMNAAGAVEAVKTTLFDKVIAIHTTPLPYREYDRLFGGKSLEDFLISGGMMQTGALWGQEAGVNTPLSEKQFVRAYIDNVICQDMGQEKSDRIREEIYNLNEEIMVSIFSHDFKLYDWSGVARLLRGGVAIDEEEEQEGIRYLEELDLYVPYTTIRLKSGERTENKGVFTLLWIRYSQVKTLLDDFMEDSYFANLRERDKRLIRERMLEEAKERMLADAILQETVLVSERKNKHSMEQGSYVCRLYIESCPSEKAFLSYDSKTDECWLYVVRYSEEADTPVPAWMTEDALRRLIEKRFGRIIDSCILYLGDEHWTDDGIHYKNAGDYLRSL